MKPNQGEQMWLADLDGPVPDATRDTINIDDPRAVRAALAEAKEARRGEADKADRA